MVKKIPPKKATVTAIKNPVTQTWYYPLGIVLFTFLLYFTICSADFINYDDPSFVLGNVTITTLSLHNLGVIFSSYYLGNYCPLSILSYAIDYHFAGLNPTLFHLVSLFIHLANTWLVFLFVYRLSNKQILLAAIATLLFGIHPMHVESVAWVAERRDVLYTLFFLLGLISYLRYVDNHSLKNILFTLLFFLGSLLSKGQAVTFPVILLVVDYIQNRKVDRKAILEKIPFFALSIFFGFITLAAQKSTPAINPVHLNYINRLFTGNYGLLLYLVKVIVPFHLAGYQPYPFSGNQSMPFIIYLSPIIIIALGFVVFKKLSRDRNIIGGLLFFLLSIFPVLQFFPVGDTLISERYTYVPYIGLFFVIGHIYSNIDKYKMLSGIKKYKNYILIAFLATLSIITFNYVKVWGNSVSFWTNVIEQYPDSKVPYNNRGYMYNEYKQYDLALNDFNKGIAIDSGYARLYLNRGLSYQMQQRNDLAIKDYTKSISLDTTEPQTYLNRGSLYTDVYGKYDSGIQDFKHVLQLDPNSLPAINNTGVAFYKKGDFDNALTQFNKSIEKNPADGNIYYLRAAVYAAKKDYQKAVADANKSKQLGFAMDEKLLKEWESQAK